MKNFMRSYARHKGGVIGLVTMLLIAAIALFAGVLFPQSPWEMVNGPFMPPLTEGALLGTDTLGRDIASGIAHGARISLMLGVVSTVVATLFGTTLGALSGYFGGKVDQLLMGLTELFQTVPSFLLAVVLVAILTPSLGTIVLTVAVVSWPPLARLVRAEFMSLRSREFVQAASLSG